MQITFYGTGSCMPGPKSSSNRFRSYSGWYTKTDSDSLLFDIGGGVLHKMLEDGVDILKAPTHLFISHLHIDHTIDMFQLMQGRFVANRSAHVNKSNIYGPEGMKDLINVIWNSYGEEFKIDDLFEIKEVVSGLVFEGNGWKISSSPIEHYKKSICYRLDADGKSVIYSGDMGYDERICELGKNTDLAIMECTFPDSRAKNHIGPQEIGKLAKLGNFKKIILTHMAPACDGREDEIVKTIKNIVDIEVIVGYDFLKIDI